MKALDLFSGATGAWHYGFNAAGIDVVAGCEFDPWRRAVYAARYRVPVYSDVRTLTGEQVTRDHGTIDVVCGSPPCQDASTANTSGKGVDGERTGLFFEAIRIAGELRPRWVCLENVPGLRARGYDRIQDALEALGYECRPVVVGAWHAGAPHRRNRVVVIANLPGVERGQGRPGRSDPGDAREPEQAFHDAHPETVFRETVSGCQSDGVGARVAADASQSIAVRRTAIGGRIGRTEAAARYGSVSDADSDGLRLQSRRRSGSHGSEATKPQGGVARNADGAGLALGQDERCDRDEEQPAAIGAVLARWSEWNGGPPALGGMDDGLPAALAARRGLGRACLAAYGDSFVPIFPELIGRFIRQTDAGEFTR